MASDEHAAAWRRSVLALRRQWQCARFQTRLWLVQNDTPTSSLLLSASCAERLTRFALLTSPPLPGAGSFCPRFQRRKPRLREVRPHSQGVTHACLEAGPPQSPRRSDAGVGHSYWFGRTCVAAGTAKPSQNLEISKAYVCPPVTLSLTPLYPQPCAPSPAPSSHSGAGRYFLSRVRWQIFPF